jgi:ribosomal protein L11 methyltransferase
MYIWRKSVTADWLRARHDELQYRFGRALAIVETLGKARALVEVACQTGVQARQLRRELGGSTEKLRPDWLQQLSQENRSKPLRVGSRLIVLQNPNETKKANTIIIPAEAAFGTGDHATTAMCLRILERVTRKMPGNWSMLDAGTGSGILAIAAARFGARRVLAIDNDPSAIATATRNAKANHARHIQFRTADILAQKFDAKVDIIAANLYSEILVKALRSWQHYLSPDGRLLLSGILRSQEKAVIAALRQNGFAQREVRRRGKWIALLAWRPPKKS